MAWTDRRMAPRAPIPPFTIPFSPSVHPCYSIPSIPPIPSIPSIPAEEPAEMPVGDDHIGKLLKRSLIRLVELGAGAVGPQ